MGRYVYYNPNPRHRATVGDCAIRAVAKATGKTWEEAYISLFHKGYQMGDIPNSDEVWGAYLHENGFRREIVPNTCPDCYTINDFCLDHPEGIYVLGTGTHAVCIVDGYYYDVWNSGDAIPIFCWHYIEKE